MFEGNLRGSDQGNERIREDIRAHKLRSAFRVLKGDSAQEPGPLRSHSFDLAQFPRFRAADLSEDFWTKEHSLQSSLAGVRIELCQTSIGIPFAQITYGPYADAIARWPLFPVLGGDNGPGVLSIKGWKVRIAGSSGRLELLFVRDENKFMQWIGRFFGSRPLRSQLILHVEKGRLDQIMFRVKHSDDWSTLQGARRD